MAQYSLKRFIPLCSAGVVRPGTKDASSEDRAPWPQDPLVIADVDVLGWEPSDTHTPEGKNVFPVKGVDCRGKEHGPARGHLLGNAMAQADTPKLNKRRAASTFTYLNCAPSYQPFDGAIWGGREKAVMDIATHLKRGVHYIAGPTPGKLGTIPSTADANENSVDVHFPRAFWAVMVDPGEVTSNPVNREPMALAWMCNQIADVRVGGKNGKNPPCHYLSVDELEEEIGFDPVPGLAKKWKNGAKARKNSKYDHWNTKTHAFFPEPGKTVQVQSCEEWR